MVEVCGWTVTARGQIGDDLFSGSHGIDPFFRLSSVIRSAIRAVPLTP